jgi:hypothetical protein
VAVAGPDTAFDDSDVRFSDLANDPIVVVETAPCGMPWIVPGDIDINRLLDGFTSVFDGQGVFVGFRDGTAWYLDKTVPVELVKQFSTTSGASELNRDTYLRQFVRFGDTDR